MNTIQKINDSIELDQLEALECNFYLQFNSANSFLEVEKFSKLFILIHDVKKYVLESGVCFLL